MSTAKHKPFLHPAANTHSVIPGNRSTVPNALLSQQLTGENNLASSSASSSQNGSGNSRRADQVVHRFYLKTVNVLVDARLTHYGGSTAPGPSQQPSEKILDRWFNLTLPETDLYKSDLAVYRHVSSYQPYSGPTSTPSAESCTIPPLLIAFILDTSDLPNGQALLWCRDGGKVALNTNLIGNKGKGKEKEKKKGIVLERWTYRAQLPPTDTQIASQVAAHTAYRLGIIHFRAVYSLIRLLPAFRLFRRLRRANNGLRLGIKLWGPEGYPNTPEGLAEAWSVMERGLVGLDTGLDELVSGEQINPEEIQQYDFPKVDMFGTEYTLGVEYRPEVDFAVEDMEAVLSEKFVDMDEDWFKPTVARKRAEDETVTSEGKTISRKLSIPSSIPSNASPIPHRQQALPVGSLASAGAGSSVGSRPSGSRIASGQRERLNIGSLGTDRWTPLAENLPFAANGSTTSQRDGQSQEPPSPSMATPAAIVAARRLSGHSIQPFASASPSASLLRSTPPQYLSGTPIPTTSARPVLGSSRPSSIGRTSSFLSQSGRSFTHAQIANMYAGSASPPITGTMSGVGVPIPSSPPPGQSPVSPSSFSFTKQPVPRSLSGRSFYMTPSGSSPFIPGSLEKDSGSFSSATGPPGIIKRYSSSLSQRQGRPIGGQTSGPSTTSHAISGSQGSSADGSSLPGSVSQGLSRRASTRESGLRHSHEAPSRGSEVRVAAEDEDDIQAFLKTLDALPQPPSLAAQAAQASRSHLPSTSSSLSGGPSATHTPPYILASSGSPGAGFNGRIPLTRQQVEEELKRMAGSFSLNNQALNGFESTPTSGRASGSGSTNPSSIGLLSASRPSSASRRVSAVEYDQGQPAKPMYRRQTSGGRSPLGPGGSYGSPIKSGFVSPPAAPASNPPTSSMTNAGGASPMQALKSADTLARHNVRRTSSGFTATSAGAARSLPGRATGILPPSEDEPLPLRSDGVGAGVTSAQYPIPHSTPAGFLSPQTTGGTSSTTANDSVRSRRGPVLLRGGFGDPSSQRTQSQTQAQGQSYGSTVSSPSHSPVRDLGLVRGVGLGISRAGSTGAGVGTGGEVHAGSVPSRGISERLGEDESTTAPMGGWRGYQGYSGGAGGIGSRRPSAVSASSTPGYHAQSYGNSYSQNSGLSSGAGGGGLAALTGPGISGYPGLPSTNSGNAYGNGMGGARGKGQRTAPSSLGREAEEREPFGAGAGVGAGVGGGVGVGARRGRTGRLSSDMGLDAGVGVSRVSEESGGVSVEALSRDLEGMGVEDGETDKDARQREDELRDERA